MSNKKLVFKLNIEHPNYETLSEMSSSIRNGDATVPQSVDRHGDTAQLNSLLYVLFVTYTIVLQCLFV